MQQPVIRPARPDEFADLGALTVGAYATLPSRDHPASIAYNATLRNVSSRAQRCLVLAAEMDGRLAGTVTYVPGPGPDAETTDPGAAEIRMLAVAPWARGRGIGRALVLACVATARAERRERIVLHTRLEMAHARHLYETVGFRRAPKLDFSPVAGIDLLGYTLEVAPARG